MPDPIQSDDAIRDAKVALDGLAFRQSLIGRNIANIDTPGYRASDVNFETQLKRARRELDDVHMWKTHGGHLASPSQLPGMQVKLRRGGSLRADGNNVDIDVELTQMAESGVRYQALTQLVSKKLLLLKSIVNRR